MLDPKYLLAHLTPLRWPLLSYAHGSEHATAIAALLGFEEMPERAEAWSAYMAEMDVLKTHENEVPSLRRLSETLEPDPFMDFCMLLALSAETMPTYRAVLDSMGGLTTALALRLFSSSLAEAVRWQSLWRHGNTARLLFAGTDIDVPMRLRPIASDFLLGVDHPPERCAVQHKDRSGSFLILHYDDISDNRDWHTDVEVYLALTDARLCFVGLPDNGRKDKAEAMLRAIRCSCAFVLLEDDLAEPGGYSLVPFRVLIPGHTGELTLRQNEQRRLHHLDKLASKVHTGYTWDDLILPPEHKRLLRHICDRVVHSKTIYGQWGMDAGASYGRGVRALFSGPPGTGKTMAAQIIARKLNMELYTVNLSALVSKYIGETEKNLEEIFIEAEKSGGILFFDEADALFGRRGEQKDSHDKYANMQAAFLLQRFENYNGMVMLATNLISNLDPAFLRRIQIRVEFPLPDSDLRLKIWKKQLTGCSAPLSGDVDISFLAEAFELTGSVIRSIALTAAFMAAADHESIGMRQLIQALVMEFSKLDKVITARDLGEYHEHIQISETISSV